MEALLFVVRSADKICSNYGHYCLLQARWVGQALRVYQMELAWILIPHVYREFVSAQQTTTTVIQFVVGLCDKTLLNVSAVENVIKCMLLNNTYLWQIYFIKHYLVGVVTTSLSLPLSLFLIKVRFTYECKKIKVLYYIRSLCLH